VKTKFLAFFLIIPLLSQSCVKDEGKIPVSANTAGGATFDDNDVATGTIYTGSDPLTAQAWHIKNTGQKAYSQTAGLSGQDSKINDAHELGYTGKNIRIAVSDSGVDLAHPDLSGNQLVGEHRNYFSDNPFDWIDAFPVHQGDAHGTAVTGIVSARGWNGIGTRGVAPDSKFAAFSFLLEDFQDSNDAFFATSYKARNLDQTQGDFDIFNYSYGRRQYKFWEIDGDEMDALESGVTLGRSGKGSLYVQSSGNSYIDFISSYFFFGNSNMDSSLSSPHKIVVGALNANGVVASYSTPGSNIWVSAAGGEDGIIEPAIITTDITGCDAGYSFTEILNLLFDFGSHHDNGGCNYTNRMNGTSSAAPVVSGVIAMILEAKPTLTWRDIKHILAVTADQVDTTAPNNLPHPGLFLGQDLLDDLLISDIATMPIGYVYDVKWMTNSAGFKFSNWYGFGRVNALQAVLMATTYNSNLSPQLSFEDVEYGPVNIIDFSTDFAEIPITVSDQNMIIETVEVQVAVNHTSPQDLALHLVSPSGRVSRVILGNNNAYFDSSDNHFSALTNAFYGESSDGVWRIRVYDLRQNGEEGTLERFVLKIRGRAP
jgi:subtilisin family serine protease